MDVGSSTPLLDFFRRGEVARDVRLLAAQGALAPRAHEQLGLLILLVDDPDPEVRAAADATLGMIPRAALEAFLARSDVAESARRFFAARGVQSASGEALASDGPLYDIAPAGDTAAEDDAPAEAGSERLAVVQKIAKLGVPERMALAMKGTREERMVLVRDPNKIVAISVLSSPRITETEVEAVAKMANVSEEVLRAIANTRTWMKNYAVCAALTRNAKTPVAVSMNLIARLTEKDLKMLSIDRNVPDILRLTARRKVTFERR